MCCGPRGHKELDKIQRLNESHRWQARMERCSTSYVMKELRISTMRQRCTPVKSKESKVAQSCPTLCNPMDCSLPGSSVHGIFQARVLEWVRTAQIQSSDIIKCRRASGATGSISLIAGRNGKLVRLLEEGSLVNSYSIKHSLTVRLNYHSP